MKMLLLVAMLFATTACTRIETGEVGVRVEFDKEIDLVEIPAGKMPQTLWGSVLTFQVKNVTVQLDNLTPQAKDNSTMSDFDGTIIYNLNPASVAELYISNDHTFHEYGEDIKLMYNHIHRMARNAIYKSARKYEALNMNDFRPDIELEVKELMQKALAEEKLDNSITIHGVMIRQILPAESIVQSANELVKAKNELLKKTVEVDTAKKEADRIGILNSNAGATKYMAAMAQLKIAEAVANGKVQTIIIPQDFKGMINVDTSPK